jgi:hypothetical protein
MSFIAGKETTNWGNEAEEVGAYRVGLNALQGRFYYRFVIFPRLDVKKCITSGVKHIYDVFFISVNQDRNILDGSVYQT